MHSFAPGLLTGSVSLSLEVRHIWETTSVTSAGNSLIITLHLSGKVYEGSKLIFSGLVSSVYETCLHCFKGTFTLGSGCSFLCEQCPESPDGELPPGACVPVLEDTYSNPHPVFVNSLGVWSESGDLTLTVAENAKIEDSKPLRIVLKMRNRNIAEVRKECWRFGNPDRCLSVYVSGGKLCTDVSPLPVGWDEGERCRYGSTEASSSRASIARGAAATDRYGRLLLDTCATCLRPADIIALDTLLQQQRALILRGLKVHAPSSQGVPQFVVGSLVAGNYSVRLDLTNWLDKRSSTEHEIAKDLGTTGQTGLEDLKPTIYIQVLTS